MSIEEAPQAKCCGSHEPAKTYTKEGHLLLRPSFMDPKYKCNKKLVRKKNYVMLKFASTEEANTLTQGSDKEDNERGEDSLEEEQYQNK